MKKLYLIRGARLSQQLQKEYSDVIEETTYSELKNNTLRFIPPSKRRQFSTDPIQINELRMIPFVDTNDLKVESVAHSNSNKEYDIVVLFMNIDYEESDQNDNITFKATDGDDYHITPIPLNNVNVKVRCECLDFYWRFAVYNFGDGSLYGPKPPPYQKKTNRPPVNPEKTPGVCKHIMKTILALKDAGVVKD